jgi:acyl-CoA reductase-like NAD-dependent aldehyde dehydrogenase
MVVLPDVDMTEAGEAAVSAAVGSAGERCLAASVLVAGRGAAQRFEREVEADMIGINVAIARLAFPAAAESEAAEDLVMTW